MSHFLSLFSQAPSTSSWVHPIQRMLPDTDLNLGSVYYAYYFIQNCFPKKCLSQISWLFCSCEAAKIHFFPCGHTSGFVEEMATHSSILAWRIPWTEEPGGYSPRGRKESDMNERLHSLTLFWLKYHLCRKVREGRMGAPGSLSTGSSPKSPQYTFGAEPLNTCREQLTSSLSNFFLILVDKLTYSTSFCRTG